MMKKQSILLVIALICVLLGGTIFYYNNIRIPGILQAKEAAVRKEVDERAMPKRTTAVVIGEEGIPKYTVMTDEIIASHIKMVEIPEKYIASGAVFDIDLIKGKISKEDLRYGEQIVLDSVSADTKWFEDDERLKEYPVSGIVAGTLQAGNIIDLIVNYDNGTYDTIVPKVKVQKLIEKEDTEEKKQHIIILAVNEEQYGDLEMAKKLGDFETRIYLDEGQPKSAKTFDRALAMQRLNLRKQDITVNNE